MAFILTSGILLFAKIIFLILFFIIKKPYLKSYLELILLLLHCASLLTFIIFYDQIKNNLELQITKRITFLIIFLNFLLIIWSRFNYLVWFLLLLTNIIYAILGYYLLENFSFEEILIETFFSCSSFIIKKFQDKIQRELFLNICLLKKSSESKKVLINSNAGLHFRLQGDQLIYGNNNVKNLLNKVKSQINLRSKNINYN